MRTIIDLPENQLIPLAEMAKERGVSRAEMVRQALEMLLKSQEPIKKAALRTHPAFGMWKKHKKSEDSVAYQQRLRAEWDVL